MAIIIELTQLSPTMETGTFVRWLKKQGDGVEPGDLLAEIETDKAVMELEAYDEGLLLAQLAAEGDRLPLGAPLGILGQVGEDIQELLDKTRARLEELKKGAVAAPEREAVEVPDAAAGIAEQKETTEEEVVAPPAETEETSAPTGEAPIRSGRIKASPLARKIAAEKGVELAAIRGSGPGGRITSADVRQQIRTEAGSMRIRRRPDEKLPITDMRGVIARRLQAAKNKIPHFYLNLEFDAGALDRVRRELNGDLQAKNPDEDLKVSFNDLIVKACALSLVEHPQVNSSWREDHILQHGRVDVGVAVALPGGLIIPYIRNADQLPLLSIVRQTRELVAKARERKLKPEEFTDGTFTISNLGMFGITHFSAIINDPEAALLAVGGLVEKPVVDGGAIIAGKTMTVTLSCDHRVIDGAEGARFLQTFQQFVEHPHLLLVGCG